MNAADLRSRLAGLDLELPAPPAAVASYLPAVVSGPHLFISGQLPLRAGELTCRGPIPDAATVAQAADAAALCVLNALAAADAALQGDWSRFRRVARLAAFVAATPCFTDHHLVANGASDLLQRLFGDPGRHARAAVGVPSLPLGAAVEVELLLEVAAP